MQKFVVRALPASVLFTALPAAAQVSEPAPRTYPDAFQPRVEEAASLSGLRIEASGGYDRLEVNIIEDDTKYYDGTDGIRYAGEIGYDIAVSNKVLVGAFVAYAGTSVKRCDDFEEISINPGEFISGTLCQKAKAEISGGVRVGLRLGAQSQLYGKVGYSSMPIIFSIGDDEAKETYAGFHFGFGGELGLGGGAFAKAELVATNFRTGNKIFEGYNLDRRYAVAGIGVRF